MLYRIRLYGFDPVEIEAGSASAAKYACWRKAEDAGFFAGKGGFKRFLERAHVQRIGGEPKEGDFSDDGRRVFDGRKWVSAQS